MRDLAAAGVEFRMLTTMAHAKAVVVDGSLAMCGSINLDLRSLLLNHEAAVIFYGPQEIAWFTQWIDNVAEAGLPFDARPPGHCARCCGRVAADRGLSALERMPLTLRETLMPLRVAR